MDEAEVTKICRSCGEDLRHKKRRKSRDGTYLCPNCIRAENRWDRRLLATVAHKRTQRFAFYVVLAVLAGVIFWSILDVMSEANSGPP
jgi:hypothetical protein